MAFSFGVKPGENGIGDRPLEGADDMDTPTAVRFSPDGLRVASTNWDSKVRVWHTIKAGSPKAYQIMSSFTFPAPLMDVAWMSNEQIMVVGCDCNLHLIDLPSGSTSLIGSHDEPIQAVQHRSSHSLVMTGGWDRKVRYWDIRTPKAAGVLDVRSKVYAMDSVDSVLVVGNADREMIMVNLDDPMSIFRTQVSPLKYQTTCLSVYSGKDGFAVGSIEGRCSIRYLLQDVDSRRSFAFKCHRLNKDVYPVNAIAWHPFYSHAFATVGGDGTLAFWDKDKKQRLKNYPKGSLHIDSSLVCATWDPEGVFFAYAQGYDWNGGPDTPKRSTKGKIWLRKSLEQEMKRA